MTIPSLVLNPLQFCDQNGKPYAGGMIFTRIMGTYTPKITWKDPWQSAVNENPLTLDAAGRCEIWADGDYQIQLNDAAGNMIFNVPASTIISAAMYPVVSAPSIPDAVAALGIGDLIAVETSARVAADNTEATTRLEVDADLHTLINAEVTDRTNADNTEKNERVTEDLTLQAQIDALTSGGTGTTTAGVRMGYATTDASGYITATFSPAFSYAVKYFTILGPGVATYLVGGPQPSNTPDLAATVISVTTINLNGITLRVGYDTGTGPSGYVPYGAGISIGWWAVGA
jgi:hypothetical protein